MRKPMLVVACIAAAQVLAWVAGGLAREEPVPFKLDHFKCYQVLDGKPVDKTALLREHLRPAGAAAGNARRDRRTGGPSPRLLGNGDRRISGVSQEAVVDVAPMRFKIRVHSGKRALHRRTSDIMLRQEKATRRIYADYSITSCLTANPVSALRRVAAVAEISS